MLIVSFPRRPRAAAGTIPLVIQGQPFGTMCLRLTGERRERGDAVYYFSTQRAILTIALAPGAGVSYQTLTSESSDS